MCAFEQEPPPPIASRRSDGCGEDEGEGVCEGDGLVTTKEKLAAGSTLGLALRQTAQPVFDAGTRTDAESEALRDAVLVCAIVSTTSPHLIAAATIATRSPVPASPENKSTTESPSAKLDGM
jgi:hypothetical protein